MKRLDSKLHLVTFASAFLLVALLAAPTEASLVADSTTPPSATFEPEDRGRDVPELRPVPAEALQTTFGIATIITNTTPSALALAMDIPAVHFITGSFNGSDPRGIGIGQSPLGFHLPASGNSFVILSTGWAQAAEWPNNQGNLSFALDGLNNSQGNDLVQLDLRLVAPANANCASFDFAFFSEEFPEYVGSLFNDTFTAELGGTNLTISGTQVIAPLNFAFDVANKIISVNTVSGVSAPTNTTYDGKTPLRSGPAPIVRTP
ncbi:MAG: hypothetical protein KatS3mg053_2543 [Candidatus Roseilinea sp.]|nr:MAG: hypothetical protein KatS3mg053_2543 [Candidatus Roseilinea sp.]